LQDLQLPLFLTPAQADKWIWGAGPIVQFPSATASGLGTGKWSAGPTGAILYSNGPWLNGLLVSHLWSFAGNPDRAAVNQTSLEVLVSYNFQSGWFVQFHPVNTYDWTADSRNAWTVPVGLDAGRVFDFGERSISVQLGVYKTVARPEGAPDWVVRAQIQFSLPDGQVVRALAVHLRKQWETVLMTSVMDQRSFITIVGEPAISIVPFERGVEEDAIRHRALLVPVDRGGAVDRSGRMRAARPYGRPFAPRAADLPSEIRPVGDAGGLFGEREVST